MLLEGTFTRCLFVKHVEHVEHMEHMKLVKSEVIASRAFLESYPRHVMSTMSSRICMLGSLGVEPLEHMEHWNL